MEDYNVGLLIRLQDREYAEEYLLRAVDCGKAETISIAVGDLFSALDLKYRNDFIRKSTECDILKLKLQAIKECINM